MNPNTKHACSEYHLNRKSKINRTSDYHLLKVVAKYCSITLLFECLFMKIRLLLQSLCNTTLMSLKKWIETDSSLPTTEKQDSCVLKT